MKSHEFYLELSKQLHEQFTQEQDSISKSASLMCDAIEHEGLIHVFGSGHSQMFALEMFYRSGGLVPVNALLYPQMSVPPIALMSSVFERLEGWADAALDFENVNSNDVFICASVSGRNGSVIDMALAAKMRGCKIIALTSIKYSSQVASRHSSGHRLMDLADVVIDLKCPLGDASLSIEGVESKFSPTSSILGMAVINALVAQTVENCVKRNIDPPLWVSANLDSRKGEMINKEHVKKYSSRIRFL